MGRPKGSKNKSKTETASAEASPSPGKTEEIISNPAKPAYIGRTALLNEIHETNKELHAADEQEYQENTEENEESPGKQIEDPDSNSDEAIEETDQPEVKPEVEVEKPAIASGQKKVKLVIDGVEKEYSESEVIALAQKAGAVDSRLAQASRILEDAKRQTATPRGVDGAATRENADQPSAPTDVDQSLIDEISDAVIYGDKDQITQAIRKLMTGRQPATPVTDPRMIQRYVSETIAFENAKQLLETPPDKGGFNDIYGDPMLRRMFEAREDELRRGDPDKGVSPDQRSYSELYKSIATELREWRDGVVKSYSKPTGLENRDQLKRSTGVVRSSGGKPPSHAQTPPMTHEDVIENMRRSRGLN